MTIVVLLILAGVSLNLVLGNNGIISKAKDAKNATEKDAENTYKALNNLYDEMIGALDEDPGGLTPGTATTPYLPSSDFSQVTGTDLNTGLVIEDGQGNQYVWIEVPKTEEVYPTAKLEITEFTDAEYTKIEDDLHTYTNTYREAGYTDTYSEDAATGLTSTEYNTLKNAMLKSVYQNGGFWIGRYEAGISAPRTSKTDPIADSLKPKSKANEYPLYYVTRSEAQTLASRVAPTGYNSSLMFGVQWDLVLKHLENKGVTQAELNSNSSSWGNYADSENLKITNENVQYAIIDQNSYTLGEWKSVPTNYTKPSSGTENMVLLTTGANEERNSKKNICDLAGNVFELTLEYSSDSSNPCATSGGGTSATGSECPASGRVSGIAGMSNIGIGFRLALY